jgi:hypothetical protein
MNWIGGLTRPLREVVILEVPLGDGDVELTSLCNQIPLGVDQNSGVKPETIAPIDRFVK